MYAIKRWLFYFIYKTELLLKLCTKFVAPIRATRGKALKGTPSEYGDTCIYIVYSKMYFTGEFWCAMLKPYLEH
jgi:hypothetical protein